MPARRRFAVVLTPLLALLGVAAAVLLPSAAAPVAAQSQEPAVTCFEITVGWRICASSAAPAERAPAQPPEPCVAGVAVPDAANNPGLVADCAILLAAKDTLRGDAALNWSAATAITAWDGVTVGGTPPRVTELRLEERGLTGTIPAEVGDLAHLEFLHLAGNRLTGAIPPELGNLTRLVYLGLAGIRLTGVHQPELGDLARWEWLRLNGSLLTGPIPPELGNLAQLEILLLGFNRLTGAIPPELGDLARLVNLDLEGNLLWGAIPPELGDLARLERLDLGGNLLWGAIPPEVGDLARLEILDLQGNLLWGAIPPEVGDLARLVYLSFIGNRLTGPIPPELSDLARLEFLNLGGNRLTGAIPPEVGDLARLETLYLHGNRLTGAIPPELGNLARLWWLWLADNRLTGAIPPGLADLPLYGLSLAENDLTGCLPREWAQVTYNDLDQLGLASCPLRSETLSYGAPVTTGSVTDDGDYAFLTDPDDLTTLVTTYEGLRDGSTTGLVVHQNDSAGTSQAAFYDLVRSGDVFEWRKANDCWVRYQVTSAPEPTAGATTWEFGVKWAAYAFTGCTGTVATDMDASVTWGPEPNFLSPRIMVPVRYGPYQLIPVGWTGAVEAQTRVTLPTSGASDASGTSAGPTWPSDDRAEVLQHPLWSAPAVPDAWTVSAIWADSEHSVSAIYGDGKGYLAADIWIARLDWHPVRFTLWMSDGVPEVRTIDGHPAIVKYSHTGAWARIFDETRGILYTAFLYPNEDDPDGRDIDDVIAIARSLYRTSP